MSGVEQAPFRGVVCGKGRALWRLRRESRRDVGRTQVGAAPQFQRSPVRVAKIAAGERKLEVGQFMRANPLKRWPICLRSRRAALTPLQGPPATSRRMAPRRETRPTGLTPLQGLPATSRRMVPRQETRPTELTPLQGPSATSRGSGLKPALPSRPISGTGRAGLGFTPRLC